MKEDYKYTQQDKNVDPEFDARYYRDMYKVGTKEVDVMHDKRRNQPIYEERELGELAMKNNDLKDKTTDGFTVTSYAQKSDSGEGDKYNIGGYSKTYLRKKYGDSTKRIECLDQSKRSDWVIEKKDGRTYFTRKRTESTGSVTEKYDDHNSRDDRSTGFTGIRYEGNYEQREIKQHSRSGDDHETWSLEKRDGRRYYSRSRTDSVGSYDRDYDEYSYDTWECKRKRSRSRSLEKFIQQQVYDSRNRRKSRVSTDSRGSTNVREQAKSDKYDSQIKMPPKFGKMYSDIHDGKRDTYKYAAMADDTDYGEFDARKYTVKYTSAPRQEPKKPKLSSAVTVTKVNKKPTISSTVKVPGNVSSSSKDVKKTEVKSTARIKPLSSKSKEKKHSTSKPEAKDAKKSKSVPKDPKKSKNSHHKSKKE